MRNQLKQTHFSADPFGRTHVPRGPSSPPSACGDDRPTCMRVPAPAIKHQLPKFCAGLNGTVSAPTFNWVVLFGLRTPIDVPGAINGSPGVAGSGGRCRSGSGCQAQAAVGHLVRLWTAAARVLAATGAAQGRRRVCGWHRRAVPACAAIRRGIAGTVSAPLAKLPTRPAFI